MTAQKEFDYEGLRLHWSSHCLAIVDVADGSQRLPMDWTAAEMETVARFIQLSVASRDAFLVQPNEPDADADAPTCAKCPDPCWLDPATKRYALHCRHHLEHERLRSTQNRARTRLAKSVTAVPKETPAPPAPAGSHLQVMQYTSTSGRHRACKVRHYHGVVAGYYTACHLCGWTSDDAGE